MGCLRAVCALFGIIASMLVLAPPAQASTTNCYTSSLVTRCAGMGTEGPSLLSANGRVRPLAENVRTRVAVVRLQRLTSNGWRTVSTHRVDGEWFKGSSLASARLACSDAPRGQYRSHATLKWKRGANGTVRTGVIISEAIPKSLVCG